MTCGPNPLLSLQTATGPENDLSKNRKGRARARAGQGKQIPGHRELVLRVSRLDVKGRGSRGSLTRQWIEIERQARDFQFPHLPAAGKRWPLTDIEGMR